MDPARFQARLLLVVTGTRREGTLAAGPGTIVLAGGGDGARLAGDLARLAPDACGIISFGAGGGLWPGHSIGDLVIGNRCVGAHASGCDPAWVAALTRGLPHARIGPVFADGSLLADIAQKHRAGRMGAIIADMESHLASAAAVRHDLPFAILRCISDTAETDLPAAVAVAMRTDGGLAFGAILASILRQPGQLPAVIRTGTGFGRAFSALRTATQAVGQRLGFDQR